MNEQEVYRLSSGEVILWAEPGGPIMVKVTEPHGDPIELNADEAKKLADILVKLAREID